MRGLAQFLFDRALKPPLERCVRGVAFLHRRRLDDVVFIGVTGSYGKSTTTALLAAIMAAKGKGVMSRQINNSPYRVARTLLTVRPTDAWCVHELGGFGPGVLARSTDLLRPSIGIITHVGTDHYGRFHGAANVAREKGTLAERIDPGGVAVLNADDPYFGALRARARSRVITYGRRAEADVRAEVVASVWPERLSLDVVSGEERVRVRTRLLGEHWAYAVLAAAAAGLAAGVPLAEAARRMEQVEPVEGRLSVMEAGGVTFVLDVWKASAGTVPAALDWLRQARAERKIAIFGTLSDYPGSADRRYRMVARDALGAADVVLFVGPNAHCAKAAQAEGRLLTFETARAAHEWLNGNRRKGDLILLKGSVRADHLERLALAARNAMACRRTRCRRYVLCSNCRRGRGDKGREGRHPGEAS